MRWTPGRGQPRRRLALGDEEPLFRPLVAHGGDFEEGIPPAGIGAGDSEGVGDIRGAGLRGCVEHALAAILADADELQRGGAHRGQRLVVVGGQGRRQGHARLPRLEPTDDEVMAFRPPAADGTGKGGERWGVADGAQGAEASPAELGAGLAGFAGEFPRTDLGIERAEGVEVRGGAGEAEVGELLLAQGGEELLAEEGGERGLVPHEPEADDFLKPQRVRVGPGGEERIARLEQIRKPGEAIAGRVVPGAFQCPWLPLSGWKMRLHGV